MANGKGYPQIILTEEGMRNGLQIEDANIAVDKKVALLDALSETGLKRIVVGSFVSPKYTPQMKHIDEIMHKFHPKPGVTYLALALNAKGVERSQEYSPPLTIERSNGWVRGRPKLFCHMCDVFIRRNTNRSQLQEMASWPATVAAAKEKGAKEAGIGINATFGSNFVGDFTVEMVMKFLEKQHALWDDAGIKVVEVSIGDPMGWCHPHQVEQILGRMTWGQVSRAGPRPTRPDQFFSANAPFVETIQQATHFKLGPEQYDGCIVPWSEPITSPYLDRVKKGLPPYEVNGSWPWEEDFFPKPAKGAEAV